MPHTLLPLLLLKRGIRYLSKKLYRYIGDQTENGHFVAVLKRQSDEGSIDYKYYLFFDSAEQARLTSKNKREAEGDEVVYKGSFNSKDHFLNRRQALAVLEFTEHANQNGNFDVGALERKLTKITANH